MDFEEGLLRVGGGNTPFLPCSSAFSWCRVCLAEVYQDRALVDDFMSRKNNYQEPKVREVLQQQQPEVRNGIFCWHISMHLLLFPFGTHEDTKLPSSPPLLLGQGGLFRLAAHQGLKPVGFWPCCNQMELGFEPKHLLSPWRTHQQHWALLPIPSCLT